jgi:hypothetical protein
MSKETRKPSNNPFTVISSGSTGLASQSTGSTSQASAVSPPDAVPDRESDSDAAVLNEELPPAYTPAADSAHGEETVEFGPRRPFQPPPQAPPGFAPRSHSHGRSHSHSRTQREQQSLLRVGASAVDLLNRSSSSDLFVYPGNNRQSRPSRPPRGRLERVLSPPPRHPSASESSISSANSNRTGLSDFARDFYAAGADVELASSEPSTPAATSSTPKYTPPSGPPPPPKVNAPRDVPDDGRPTKTPVPGHPLLHNDQILVYPAGYVCDKCMFPLVIVCIHD